MSQSSVRSKSRVRVLFCECGRQGGSVRQLCKLLMGLDAERFEAGFLSYYSDQAAARLFELPGLFCRCKIPIVAPGVPDMMKPLGSLWIPTPFAFKYLACALWVLVRHRPDVVYLNNLPAEHLPVVLIARIMRIPVIAHLRTTRELLTPNRVALPHVAAFVALSEAGKVYYTSQGIDSRKLRVAYDVLALGEFDAASKMSAQDPLPLGPVYAVQVGTLNENKRPMMAVEAMLIARETCPNLKLVLVGDGPKRGEIEEYTIDQGLGDDVIFLGNREDVPSILRQCHMGFLLSKYEGFPNVIHEYMAARLPVVASGLSAIDEMVQRDRTAFVLDPPTPQTVADALVTLYHDVELRNRMGNAGREMVEQSPSAQYQGLDAVSECILEAAGRSFRKGLEAPRIADATKESGAGS